MSTQNILAGISSLSVLVSWWYSRTPVVRCECGAYGDSPVLQILQSQLDRCGLEQLTLPAVAPPAGFSTRILDVFLTGVPLLLLGIAIGRLSCTYTFGSLRPRTKETSSEVQLVSLSDAPRWAPEGRPNLRRL